MRHTALCVSRCAICGLYFPVETPSPHPEPTPHHERLPPPLPLIPCYRGDCLDGLAGFPEGWVDLAFADPPFNIGYDYDVYEDRTRPRRLSRLVPRWIAGRPPRPQARRHLLAGHRRRVRRRAEGDRPPRSRVHLRSWVDLVLHVRRQLHEEVQPQPRATCFIS